MKKILLFLPFWFVFGLLLPCFSFANQLIISEYCVRNDSVASVRNYQYVELFNASAENIDLSQYQLWISTDGNGWNKNGGTTNAVFALSGNLKPGHTFVVADAGGMLNNVLPVVTIDATCSSFGLQGNTAVALAVSDGSGGFIVSDVLGDPSVTASLDYDIAGVLGASLNHVIVRKPHICKANSEWALSSGNTIFDSEWLVMAGSNVEYIANHRNFCFEPAEKNALSALFVGNSYTLFNEMPQIVEELATSVGNRFIHDVSALSGTNIRSHYANEKTRRLLSLGGWNYVVFQEHSLGMTHEMQIVEDSTYVFFEELDRLRDEYNKGSRSMLYMTWGRDNQSFDIMNALIKERYLILQDRLGALISPVGAVWEYVRYHYPDIVLYISDESHPSVAGSYLIACTFYTALFRQDPQYLTYNFVLPDEEAICIRSAVKEVLFDSLFVWNQYDLNANAQKLKFINIKNNQVYYAGDELDFSVDIDGGSVIGRVQYFVDDDKVLDDGVFPFEYKTMFAEPGDHIIRALYVDAGGDTYESWVRVVIKDAPIIEERLPYSGEAFAIPCVIEAENFDYGGEGISYHDISSENQGLAYRNTRVDICKLADTSFAICYVRSGEWLTYSVSVDSASLYSFAFFVSAQDSTGAIHLELNSRQIGESFSIEKTGNWSLYKQYVENIFLPKGNHVLKVYFERGGFNLDRIHITFAGLHPVGLDSPKKLVFSDITAHSVKLKWDAVDAADGYVLMQFVNGQFTEVARLSELTYAIDGLDSASEYTFRIQAYKEIEADVVYSDYSEASVTTKTKAVPVDISPVYINFAAGGFPPDSVWNNVPADLLSGSVLIENAHDEQGNGTGISVELGSTMDGALYDAHTTENNSGIYPDVVLKTCYWQAKNSEGVIVFKGLDTSLIYSFHVFGARTCEDERTTLYRLGGQEHSLVVTGNSTTIAVFDSVRVSENGELTLTFAAFAGAGYGYLNAVVIIPRKITQTLIFDCKHGWNLFYLPIQIKKSNVDSVFKGIKELQVKNFDSFYRYSNYDVLNLLKEIDSGSAYLVYNGGENVQLHFEGTELTTPFDVSSLYKGWNLVGVSQTILVSELPVAVLSVKSLDSFYTKGNKLSDLDKLHKGNAYFVKVE